MSTKFTLLGWSASGLRCPDHEVNLCPPNSTKPYPVALIQMPNGTGKTTTLNMLRATLSQSAIDWNHDTIRSLQKRSNSPRSGQFVLRTAINDIPLTFELNFNFTAGNAYYRTSYGTGIKDGFFPPPQLRKFLNQQFVSLFVFDGELASNLLDAKQTHARQAIDSLFQLSLLKNIEQEFQDNWQRHAENTSAKSEQGLSLRKNKLEKLKKRQSGLKQEQKSLNKRKFQLESDLKNAQEDYNTALSKDSNIGSQLQAKRTQFEEADKKVAVEIKQTIAEIRNPQKLLPEFGDALKTLKSNLDRLKLPTSTSKEFFEELSQAEECVCGRCMDDATRQEVRRRAKQYLADDEVGVLNSIKFDIATYCSGNSESYYQELQEQIKELGQLIRERDDFKTELRSIEEERLSQGDTELEDKKKYLEHLQGEFSSCSQRLKELERSPHVNPNENTSCLKEIDKLIEKAEVDVAEATNTLRLKRKTEIVKNILSQAHTIAREELRKLIIEETNQRITQLLSRDPILLEDIQDSLQLQGQGGASVGQTLSVSYAFLATLFHRSDRQLPFIVDSPAGALDLNVRPQVASLIPALGNQFIAFTISSERQSFVDVLHQAANQQVQYITIFRKSSKINSLHQSITSELIKETVDGLMVQGKEFFERFDLDNEM